MSAYKIETEKLVRLSSPVLVASIAQTGMGFVDTVMAGGYSAVDMAAVAIAASIWFPTIIFGIGILMALVPIIAQFNGANRQDKIPFEVQQGIIAALLLTIPTLVVLHQTQSILSWMDVEPVMGQKTIDYMYAMMFAAPGFLLFQSLRSLTDGMSLTKPAMVIGFIGLVCNVPLNYLFVYGKMGFPEMGGVGCGIATAIVYWVMLILLAIYVLTSQKLAHISIFAHFYKPSVKELSKLLRLGFPVAASIFFEVTLFAAVAILVAPLGPNVVASHQIAINFSSLIFMLPMSIGTAVSIRVGHRIGEQRYEDAATSAKAAITLGASTAVITALATILLREHIADLYTDNAEVKSLALDLLFVAAIYQVTDAIQVVSAGTLRGYKDMTAILKRTLIAYWGLGFPIGYVLAMTDWVTEPLGALGFWMGFIVGLSSAALMLGLRLKTLFQRYRQSVVYNSL